MFKFILTIALLAPIYIHAGAITDLKNHKFHIKWKEKNNQIIATTVCYNFKSGSLEKRFCRRQAVTKFKQKCKRSSDKTQSEKFCRASRMNPLE